MSENFLKSLATQGITLWEDAEKLRYRAPQRCITETILGQLKAQKPAILHYLKSQGGYAPLSYGQQALWFLHQSEPQSIAYNIPVPMWVDVSTIDVAQLQDCLQTLVNRHVMLRTVFTSYMGKPIQHIISQSALDWQEINVMDSSLEQMMERMTQQYQQPFNLERGPLFRVRLFHHEKQSILLFSLHHIVCDNWSIQVLLDELSQLYQHNQLAELEHTYLDYVHWQTDLLCKEGHQLTAYWKQQLAGELPILDLATDYPRPVVLKSRGASYPFVLNAETLGALKSLAKQQGVTLYHLLLAVFQVFLFRYTGQEDILVGSPTSASRSQGEFSKTVGYFINQIALRADLSGNPTFSAFLQRVRLTVLQAIENQNYPFPLLVKALHPHRDTSRSPLFQSFFVFQNLNFRDTQVDNETIDPLALKVFDVGQMEGQFDLILVMEESANQSLMATLKYNTDLFQEGTIRRMAEHLEILFSSVIANPTQQIAILRLLSNHQRQYLLSDCNATIKPYSAKKCIYQYFEDQVLSTPDALALSCVSLSNTRQMQLTYAELNKRANQLAYYMHEQGIRFGTVIGVFLERSINMIISFLAIVKAGCVYVPLDSQYPKSRLNFILEDAQIKWLLTEESFLTQATDLLKTSINCSVIYLDKQHKNIIKQNFKNQVVNIKSSDLAYIIYTSGSTGDPKGVMIANEGVCNLAQAQIDAFVVGAKSKILQFSSLNFDASISEIMMALCSGACLVLARNEDILPSTGLNNLLNEQKISHVTFTPSALSVLPYHKLPALESLIVAGETCSAELVKRWSPGRRFFNAYGPTEITVCATIMQCNDVKDDMPPAIGKPMDNVRIYIVDAYQQLVPLGVKGEMYIASVGLALGYLRRPELTKEKFVKLPFSKTLLYKTGDYARYRADGNIAFLGRVDDQIKVRGYRIECGEIVTAMRQYPGIQDALVVTRGDTAEKQLIGYWMTNQKIKLKSNHDLQQYLADKLPKYMIPTIFINIDAIPLTPNRKIDYQALPNPSSTLLTKSEIILASNPLQKQMLDIWQALLNIQPISVQDNFFDLGGHSLLALRLLNQIEQKIDKKLPLKVLLQAPTIEQLCNFIEQRINIDSSSLVSIQTEGNQPNFYSIHPIGGNVLCYRELALHLGNDQPFYGVQSSELKQNTSISIEKLATQYINSIEKVQPEAPYYLGGWSFGGVVAFEMAQQWQKKGQSVGLLALIDSYPTAIQPVEKTALLIYFMNDICGLMKHEEIKNKFENRLIPNSESQWITLMQQTQIEKILNQVIDYSLLYRQWQVFQQNALALSVYKPQPYHHPIVLFRAKSEQSENTTKWDDLLTNNLKTHWISGDHYSIMQSPQVGTIAKYLKNYLRDE